MNLKHHKKSCDLISCCSTEQGNVQERDEELLHLKANTLKHKTELCKNFTENGWCPYNNKCRFAHGTRELVNVPTVKCFRRKKCNGFWSKGFCTYGTRCQFGHEQIEWLIQASLKGINCILDCESRQQESKLLKMLRR